MVVVLETATKSFFAYLWLGAQSLAPAKFQQWSGNGVFCTFWLGNVLRATMPSTFSTSQLLKVLRS